MRWLAGRSRGQQAGPHVFHHLVSEHSYSNGGIFFLIAARKEAAKPLMIWVLTGTISLLLVSVDENKH